MASTTVTCRLRRVRLWSKASPPISYAGSRTALEVTLGVPMVRGGMKAQASSA